MRLSTKIVVLLSFLLLSGMEDGSTAAASSAEIVQAGNTESHATHPLDQSGLFNIFHQGEHAGNSSSNVSSPQLIVDEEDQWWLAYHNELIEKALQDWICLKVFSTLNREFIHLSLIFPFHSFF